jgi:hypothetical protein
MGIVHEHSFQCINLTFHFDTSNVTDWMLNAVAGLLITMDRHIMHEFTSQ